MALLATPFDANQYDPTQSAGGMPIGKHIVQIVGSEIMATKTDEGSGMLVLTLEIIDGPQKGIKGPYRLNLYNANETAKRIAHQQLSAVCHVTGVYNVTNTQQLHGIPFMVDVQPQKNDPQYTDVKKVFDVNGNEPLKGGQPAQPAQLAAPTYNAPPSQAPKQQPQAPPAQQQAQQPAWAPPAAPPAQQQAPQGQPAWTPPASPAQAPPAQGPAPWAPPAS